jgi:hypothetical protein
MKLKMFTTATLFGLLLVPFAHAQVSTSLRGNIPFQFQIGGAALPAGEYVVSRDRPSAQGFLTIWGLDRKTRAILFQASPTLSTSAQNANPKLVFYRYGSTSFLREVWQGSGQTGTELSQSKAERVTARQMAAVVTPHSAELASVSFQTQVK